MIYQLNLKTDNQETLERLGIYAGEHCGYFKSASYREDKNSTTDNYLFAFFCPLRQDLLAFSGCINHQFKDSVFVLNGLEKAKT